MSDLYPDYDRPDYPEAENDAAFFAGVTDVEQLAEPDNTAPGAVTARMFHPDGSPREEPGPGSGTALWSSYADALESALEEQYSRINPATDYANPWGGLPGVDEFDQQAQAAAAMRANAQAHEQGLADYVRQVGAGREYDVRDEEAIARVAGQIEQAWVELFDSWMANGSTVAQALAALSSPEVNANVDEAIRGLLEGERYRNITSRTQMGAWRARQEQQAAFDAATGQPPRKSIYETSPSLQRLARRLDGYVQRQEAHKQWFRDRGWA